MLGFARARARRSDRHREVDAWGGRAQDLYEALQGPERSRSLPDFRAPRHYDFAADRNDTVHGFAVSRAVASSVARYGFATGIPAADQHEGAMSSHPEGGGDSRLPVQQVVSDAPGRLSSEDLMLHEQDANLTGERARQLFHTGTAPADTTCPVGLHCILSLGVAIVYTSRLAGVA